MITKTGRNLVLNQSRIYTLADKISEQPISFFGSDIINSKRGNSRQIHPGRCYDFLGTNEYVEIPDDDDFSFVGATTDNPFSISVWVYIDDATNFRMASKDNGSSAREWIFITDSADKLKLLLKTGANFIGRRYDTGLTSYQGEWIHIIGTYDGSETSVGIKIYLNGIRIDDINEQSGSYSGMINTSQPVYIGQYGGPYANGKMHDFRIHSKELSKAEIWEVMCGFASGYEVGWWKMEEGGGDISFDSSGRSHHGEVKNATLSTFHVNSSTLPKSFSNNDGYSGGRYYSGAEDIYSPAASCTDLNPGTGDYTIDGWFFNTNSGASRSILSKGGASAAVEGYWINLTASDTLATKHSNGTNIYQVFSDAAVPYGWNYFCMVVDRDYAIQQYLNLLDVKITVQDEQVDVGSSNLFSIGSYNSGSFHHDSFIGTIRYTARALTLDEVRDAYNNGFTEDDDTKMIAQFDSYGNYIDTVGDRPFYYETTVPVYIPRNEFNSSRDVSGEQLKYTGQVRYNAAVSSMCADFDGTDDYINIFDNDLLSFGDSVTDSPFSVSAWINFSDISLSTIIQKGGEWDLIITASDLLGITLYDSATDITRSTPALTVYENEWTHIVATYDGSGDISGLKVYVNGERFDNQTFTTGSYVVMDNTGSNLVISSAANTNDGSMCDVRVFDKELSKTEIAIVMGGERNGSEVVWYPFSEGNGKIVYDVSGNNLHGIVTNATLSTFWGQTQTKFHYNNRRGFTDGLYLNGTDAKGEITSASNFNLGTDPLTLEVIVFSNDYTNGTQTIIAHDYITQWLWAFSINTTGKIAIDATVSTTNVLEAASTNAELTDGKTHHISVVYDPGESVKMYVDGSAIDVTVTVNSGVAINPNGDLYFANYYGAAFFEGNIYALSVTSINRSADYIFHSYKYGLTSDEYTIALWDFKDGLGINVADENANNLTLTNTVQVRTPSLSTNLKKDILGHSLQHLGGGLNGSGDIIDFTGGVAAPRWNDFRLGYVDLNGTDDYIDCGDHDDLSFGDSSTDSPFSISVWVNMVDATGFPIVGKGSYNDNPEWNVFVGKGVDEGEDDKLYFKVRDSVGVWLGRKTATITEYENEWVHIAATYDASGLVGGLKIYINNVRADTDDDSNGSYIAMNALSQPLWIGYGMTSTYADGRIRDVKIYGAELTAAQVSEDYKIGSTSVSIIRNFKLYKDAYDLSVNREHGEILGTNINFPKATADTSYEQGDYSPHPFYKKDFNSPMIECVTAGRLFSSFNQVYGVWEFDWYKDLDASTITFVFISDRKNIVSNADEGYRIIFMNTEAIRLRKDTGGGSSDLMETATSYLNIDTWYNIKVVRNSTLNEYVNGAVGTFAVYVDGVLATASTGSNPVTDNTYTSSRFMIFDNDAGDKIRNLKFNNELVNLSKFQVDNGSYKVSGDKENSFVLLERPLIQQASSRPVFRYAKTGEL